MTTTTTATKPKANGADAPASPRVRLVGVTLQLDVVTDDGETLTPVRVQPIPITAAQWPNFSLDEVLAEIEQQAITQSAPAPPA
jgi:hypothetical protein